MKKLRVLFSLIIIVTVCAIILITIPASASDNGNPNANPNNNGNGYGLKVKQILDDINGTDTSTKTDILKMIEDTIKEQIKNNLPVDESLIEKYEIAKRTSAQIQAEKPKRDKEIQAIKDKQKNEPKDAKGNPIDTYSPPPYVPQPNPTAGYRDDADCVYSLFTGDMAEYDKYTFKSQLVTNWDRLLSGTLSSDEKVGFIYIISNRQVLTFNNRNSISFQEYLQNDDVATFTYGDGQQWGYMDMKTMKVFFKPYIAE